MDELALDGAAAAVAAGPDNSSPVAGAAVVGAAVAAVGDEGDADAGREQSQAVIRDLCNTFDVREIAFDPALARETMSTLLEEGLPVVEMRQGALTMMPAIQQMERAILAGKMRHGGHPVLRFCFSNVEVVRNASGHIVKFTKPKLWLSIDGAVAAAMAVSRAAMGDGGSGAFSTSEGFNSIMEWLNG